MTAPTEPLDFRAFVALQTALEAMSQAGGYYHDVAALAVKLDPNADVDSLLLPDGPRPFVLLQFLGDSMTFVEKPDGIKHEVRVRVHWVSDSTPTDDTSRLRTFLRGCADIEKAVGVDRSFGGLVLETLVTRRQFDVANDGAEVWAMVDLSLDIRRTFGVPQGDW